MEFVYKEVTRDSTTTKDKKERKNTATEAQKLQREATLVFGPESTSIIVAEPKPANTDPTACWTNKEPPSTIASPP
jgi:hypothetical protein